MVEILRGGFKKSRKLSDLVEEQGSYDKHSSSASSGEIRLWDPSQQWSLDHSCNHISWIRKLKV
jgi:hypothetical protein